MSAFREAIAKEVKLQMMNPEFDSRRSKNGGRVFWVRLAASNGFGQFVKEHPAYDDGVSAVYTDIASALAVCQANRGDEVRVGPGYTETYETALCLSTAGVRLVGEGYGTSVPTLTISGAIHGVDIEAAGVEFENFRFASPLIDETLSMLKIQGAGVVIKDVKGLASASALNFVNCIRVVAGADDLTLKNVRLTSGENAAPASFLSFEGSVARFTGEDLEFSGSVGTAGIIDSSGVVLTNSKFKRCSVVVNGVTKPAVTLDANDPDSLTNPFYGSVEDSFFSGTHATLATNAKFSDGWRLKQVYVLEETGSNAQGALIPAVDSN